jgi:hypothetical protein
MSKKKSSKGNPIIDIGIAKKPSKQIPSSKGLPKIIMPSKNLTKTVAADVANFNFKVRP